jgi:excisionase family DNA binding protein
MAFDDKPRAFVAGPTAKIEDMAQTASNFMKVPEAAEAFGVSERTIYNWIRDGQLPALQPAGPGHSVRVDRRELLRSERRGEVGR